MENETTQASATAFVIFLAFSIFILWLMERLGYSKSLNARIAEQNLESSPKPSNLANLSDAIFRVNAVAKRGKDGRVFIDYRDWEALLAEARKASAQ